MDDRAQDSQQKPNQDSGLQTPQPDQPIPTEQERFDQRQDEARQQDESAAAPDDASGE